MIWLVLHPLPPSPVTSLYFFVFLCVACRPGGGGAKSYNNEKAWSSINHLILSQEYSHICLTTFIAIHIMMVHSSRNVLSDVRRLHEVTSILLLLELDIVVISFILALFSMSIYLFYCIEYTVSDEQVCAHGCNFAAGYSSLNISRAPACQESKGDKLHMHLHARLHCA